MAFFKKAIFVALILASIASRPELSAVTVWQKTFAKEKASAFVGLYVGDLSDCVDIPAYINAFESSLVDDPDCELTLGLDYWYDGGGRLLMLPARVDELTLPEARKVDSTIRSLLTCFRKPGISQIALPAGLPKKVKVLPVKHDGQKAESDAAITMDRASDESANKMVEALGDAVYDELDGLRGLIRKQLAIEDIQDRIADIDDSLASMAANKELLASIDNLDSLFSALSKLQDGIDGVMSDPKGSNSLKTVIMDRARSEGAARGVDPDEDTTARLRSGVASSLGLFGTFDSYVPRVDFSYYDFVELLKDAKNLGEDESTRFAQNYLGILNAVFALKDKAPKLAAAFKDPKREAVVFRLTDVFAYRASLTLTNWGCSYSRLSYFDLFGVSSLRFPGKVGTDPAPIVIILPEGDEEYSSLNETAAKAERQDLKNELDAERSAVAEDLSRFGIVGFPQSDALLSIYQGLCGIEGMLYSKDLDPACFFAYLSSRPDLARLLPLDSWLAKAMLRSPLEGFGAFDALFQTDKGLLCLSVPSDPLGVVSFAIRKDGEPIRSEPNASAAVVGTLAMYASCHILNGASGDYLLVACDQKGKQITGWARKSSIQSPSRTASCLARVVSDANARVSPPTDLKANNSSSIPVAFKLPKESVATVLSVFPYTFKGEPSDWYLVRYAGDGESKIGWVHCSMLSVIDEAGYDLSKVGADGEGIDREEDSDSSWENQ
jgi:hypothetical protein